MREGFYGGVAGFVERIFGAGTASLGGKFLAGVVDENLAHHLRGNGHKMHPILIIGLFLLN